MRLAFATVTSRRVGGIETYLEALLPAFANLGHEVALWYESDGPSDRVPITLPAGGRSKTITSPVQALALCDDWQPDAVFVQGLDSAAVERALLRQPTAVFVAHNYVGTCISGTRAWTRPVVRPCPRTFGALCLAHYLPHGCGGNSPVTMVRLYRREQVRQQSLGYAAFVVTLSAHMRDVYLRHGFDSGRVEHVPYGPAIADDASDTSGAKVDDVNRLVVAARLEPLKGVHLLIEALPLVQRATGQPLELTVLGDGGARQALEQQAARAIAKAPGVAIAFRGWLNAAERDRHISDCDVVVVPSAWPEPLGLIGLEAGRLGRPVVAFDVGGVRDWLTDGVNGRLVPAEPPSAHELARVLTEVLTNPGERARLADGARAASATVTPTVHARGLLALVHRLKPSSAGWPIA